MSKIFVTGATGFIGSNLVRRLLEYKNDVNALVRKTSYHPFLDGINVNKVYGDLIDYNSVERGMEGCDEVYHLAGHISYNKKDYDKMYQINVVGTKNIASAALKTGIKRVVHMSSTAAVGLSETNCCINENHKFNGKYGKIGYMYTKNLAEKEAINAYKKGLDIVILNPTTVFGQGDKAFNNGTIIQNIRNEKVTIAPPGGTSVVSVDDVVDGCILAMKKGKAGKRYILSNENFRYVDFFNIIAEELGKRKITKQFSTKFYRPLKSLASLLEFFNKDSKLTSGIIFFSFNFRYFDSSKARKELGWQPKVDFKTALKKAIRFYKTEGLI